MQASISKPVKSEKEWTNVKPGLEYKNINVENRDFTIIEIDPQKYYFEVFENQIAPDNKTISEVHKEQGSLLSFNGIFFTEKYEPTGLLISNGKKLHKLSKASLVNGIFTIDDQNQVKILRTNEFENSKNYIFALQNGPLLIYKDKIEIDTDSQKTASRTTIGVNNENKIIIIILRQSIFNFGNTLSLYDFAHMVKGNSAFKDLNISNLLNLDGGNSTGFAINDEYYPEIEKVQNIILTKERL